MDHELKQRLIGAVVVTALAAIFIPMLFDDPVDTSGKAVTELAIPQPPSDSGAQTAENLPENKEQVLSKGGSELSVSEEIEQPPVTGDAQAIGDPGMAQTPQAIKESPEGLNAKSSENLTGQETGQNVEPELDTGIVEEHVPSDNQSLPDVKSIEPERETGLVDEPSIKKPVVSEKAKITKVVPQEKLKPANKPQKETPRKSSSKLGRYSIQAGSFSKKQNAQALVEKLRKQGMPATLVANGNLYRVKVGPELDKKKAAEMRAKLDKQNIESLLISE